MRKLLLSAVALLLFNCSQSQVLNWSTSFTPSWSNGNMSGNANNIGGVGINSTISTSISGGSFGLANGSGSALTPTVGGAVISSPGALNLLQLAPNFSDNSQYSTMTISFSAPVTNISFYVVDIDKKNPNNAKYLDRVTITGTNGVSTYNPVLSKYDAVTDPGFLVINGNSAQVNSQDGQGDDAASNATDQRGTILVNFGVSIINSITLVYDNAPGANNNPGSQSIGISNITFTQVTLPVTLSAFSAHRASRDVVLNWTTQQENNAAYYGIERSRDGNNWEMISQVRAMGNSTSPIDYSYTDVNAPGAMLLYRLKQSDLDLNYKYSSILRVSAPDAVSEILAYPNPFKSRFNVSIYTGTAQTVNSTLYDASGKMIHFSTRNLFAGNNTFTLDSLENLARGLYYAEVRNSNGQLLGRMKLVKEN